MSDLPRSLQEMEDACFEAIKRDFSLEFKLVCKMDQTFVEILQLTENLQNPSDAQWSILAISIRTFRLLQCARRAIFSGYYDVGMNLLRAVYENTNLVRYFIKNESEAEKWLNGKEFDQHYLRKELGEDAGPYKALSRLYAHPIGRISLWGVIDLSGKKRRALSIFPKFRGAECERSLIYLINSGWFALVSLREIFKEQLFSNKEWAWKHGEWDITFFRYIQESRHNLAGLDEIEKTYHHHAVEGQKSEEG